MELSYIKKLIKLVESSGVDEVEIEEEGKRVRIVKNSKSLNPVQFPYPPQIQFPVAPQGVVPQGTEGMVSPEAKAESKFHEVRSPIVGTFYRAPSPDAEPYIEMGHKVRKGSVLCIVEAMKLMNEIESDIDGEIVKILVDDAKPVEYNQVLFLVKTS